MFITEFQESRDVLILRRESQESGIDRMSSGLLFPLHDSTLIGVRNECKLFL